MTKVLSARDENTCQPRLHILSGSKLKGETSFPEYSRYVTHYERSYFCDCLIKYIERFQRKTMTRSTKMKLKRGPLFVLRQDLFQYYYIYPPVTFLVQLHPLASRHWRVKKVCKVAVEMIIDRDWKEGLDSVCNVRVNMLSWFNCTIIHTFVLDWWEIWGGGEETHGRKARGR